MNGSPLALDRAEPGGIAYAERRGVDDSRIDGMVHLANGKRLGRDRHLSLLRHRRFHCSQGITSSRRLT